MVAAAASRSRRLHRGMILFAFTVQIREKSVGWAIFFSKYKSPGFSICARCWWSWPCTIFLHITSETKNFKTCNSRGSQHLQIESIFQMHPSNPCFPRSTKWDLKKKKIPQYRALPQKEICQLADMHPIFLNHVYYVACNESYLPQLPHVQSDIWHTNNQSQLILFNWNLNLVSACII